MQDWHYDNNGNPLHWPVDHYFEEDVRKAVFLGEKVVKYHRTITTYVNTLIRCGFEIIKLVEPQLADYLMDEPGMKDELRRPMMLLISARKK